MKVYRLFDKCFTRAEERSIFLDMHKAFVLYHKNSKKLLLVDSLVVFKSKISDENF